MKKNNLVILLIMLITLMPIACVNPSATTIVEKPEPPPEPKREWLVAIYMAADNDLTDAAILDINELEAINYENSAVRVVVLVDRPATIGGDEQSNAGWGGTRIYEIKTDPNAKSATIVSERKESIELGLEKDKMVNLDSSDPNTLKQFLRFLQTQYPEQKRALILWGHGNGWRNTIQSTGRAIGFDDSSRRNMSIKALAEVLESMKNDFPIEVIGIDTCFGATLETIYELRNSAQWLVGSANMTANTGWAYDQAIGGFIEKGIEALSATALTESIVEAYKIEYAKQGGSQITTVDLSKAAALASAFDTLAQKTAEQIQDKTERDGLRSLVLNTVESYEGTGDQYDKFLDIYDLAEKLGGQYSTVGTQAAEVKRLVGQCAPNGWKKEATNGSEAGIGVYLTAMTRGGVVAVSHSEAYTKGSGAVKQNSFVQDFSGWAPAKPMGVGFIDTVFYRAY